MGQSWLCPYYVRQTTWYSSLETHFMYAYWHFAWFSLSVIFLPSIVSLLITCWHLRPNLKVNPPLTTKSKSDLHSHQPGQPASSSLSPSIPSFLPFFQHMSLLNYHLVCLLLFAGQSIPCMYVLCISYLPLDSQYIEWHWYINISWINERQMDT